MTRHIGVLTSGGDCPGLNACLRAITLRAVHTYGWQVSGLLDGTLGLLDNPPRSRSLTPADFGGDVFRQGGTLLGTTNRNDPFAWPMPDGSRRDRSPELIAGWRQLALDGLIAIGGDGSLAILRRLAQQGGIPLVGVPKTIDNDIAVTENAIGYDTAVSVAVEALDRLQPTAASHHRIMLLEVMGRDAGHIALYAGIAGGADIILIPEIAWRLEPLVARLAALRRGDAGRTTGSALVVVAEGARTPDGRQIRVREKSGKGRLGGIATWLGRRLADAIGAEVRVTTLGHLQRGGAPTPRDRFLAAAFGAGAVDSMAAGHYDCMIAWQNRQTVRVPLADAVASGQPVDLAGTMLRTARGLGVCFGDEPGEA